MEPIRLFQNDDILDKHVPRITKRIDKLAPYRSVENTFDIPFDAKHQPGLLCTYDNVTQMWTVQGLFHGSSIVFIAPTKEQAKEKYQHFYERYSSLPVVMEPEFT